MANEARKYRTEEALRKRIGEVFSSSDQRCRALCRDLKKTDRHLEELETHGGSEEAIEEALARMEALFKQRQNLDCTDLCLFE